MKNILASILSLMMLIIISCGSEPQTITENIQDSAYDSAKALAYGADDYGMKKYVMAFLYRGSNRNIPQDSARKLQMAHLENITRMAEEGQLLLAGPFLDTGDLRGIYIFDVETVEEARELTMTDPAIKAQSLRMELRPWYGSAALIDLNQIHKTLEKKSVTED